MADKKNTNIANGILSGLVLLCGVIFSVLLDLLFKKLVDIVLYSVGVSGVDTGSYAGIAGAPLWCLGFAYIVPGIIGLIATLTRNKCAYITQMVFLIITLVIMGILFIVGILTFSTLNIYSYSDCADVFGTCVCSNGYSATFSTGFSCNDIKSIGGMAVGVSCMMVFGWAFALAATVTGGMLGCSREQVHPGVILAQGGQTTMMVSQTQYGGQPQPGAHPQYGGQPQYSGQQPYGAPPQYSQPNPPQGLYGDQSGTTSDQKY